MTKEHIIAEGMGGTLVLPASSCDTCRDITGMFERYFLQDMHWLTRAHWGFYAEGNSTDCS